MYRQVENDILSSPLGEEALNAEAIVTDLWSVRTLEEALQKFGWVFLNLKFPLPILRLSPFMIHQSLPLILCRVLILVCTDPHIHQKRLVRVRNKVTVSLLGGLQ